MKDNTISCKKHATEEELMVVQSRRERFDFTYEQKEAFGKIMREARQQKGVIQQAVAEATGVDRSTISKMERGAYPGVSLLDIGRLVRYYGIDIHEILHALGL
ncbi:MAG: helix-turn-helix domain-containing protein [Ktedonobacterales bacterium]